MLLLLSSANTFILLASCFRHWSLVWLSLSLSLSLSFLVSLSLDQDFFDNTELAFQNKE